MNEQFDYQEIFGLYAAETGSYLPRRVRKDIQLEILSLLEDALEDKSAASGQPADEQMTLDVLKEFGPPINFASNYRKNQDLISADIYPLFRLVLVMIGVIFLVQFLTSILFDFGGYQFDLLETIDVFFKQAFYLFGLVVFIFALIERTTPKTWQYWPFKEMGRTWNPAGFTKENRQKRVKQPHRWIESIIMLGLAIVVLAFPHWIGIGNNYEGSWSFIPVLSEEASRFFPWISAYFFARTILNIMLALQGYWDKKLQWIDIGTKVFGILVIVILLTGPNLFGINPAYLARHTYSPDVLNWFESTLMEWNTVFRFYFFLLLLAQSVILLFKILKMVIKSDTMKFPTITTN